MPAVVRAAPAESDFADLFLAWPAVAEPPPDFAAAEVDFDEPFLDAADFAALFLAEELDFAEPLSDAADFVALFLAEPDFSELLAAEVDFDEPFLDEADFAALFLAEELDFAELLAAEVDFDEAFLEATDFPALFLAEELGFAELNFVEPFLAAAPDFELFAEPDLAFCFWASCMLSTRFG